jgi:hypothetical protein
MSKREENPELARVLSRVNALMKHDPVMQPLPEAAVEAQVSAEAEVPVLTDVYEGELPAFASHSQGGSATTDPVTLTPSSDEGAIEAIVAELRPLIHAEVKKAVRQELVNLEKIVNHRLETEFLQTLLEKLRTGE